LDDVARAGFWAIGGYKISFRADGKWYADEEAIENPRIALLFARHVRPDGKGGWLIDVGIDRQAVVVEDTALVVRSVEGTSAQGFTIESNDGVREPLDCSELWIGRQNVLYCRLMRDGRGEFEARFLRPAYYALARWIETDPAGEASIECGGHRFPIPHRGART
jgi:hypothetical protein